MRIALINPPLGSVEQPFLALAALQGHLTRHGLTDVTIYDVSQTIVDRFLTGGYMRETLDGLAERIARLEALPALDLPAAMAYGAAVTARAAAEAALTHIDDAVATLRDPVRFYDYAAYRQAMFAVDQAFEAISGRHFPELIARRNYTGSVLQDLDSDAELQAYLAEPGRCLFAAEYARGIVDAIAASRPGLVGLSATFQDQFLPALVLARMLRARLPDAHIVMGGAFLASRRESIGARPWLFDVVDSMVVGEGETALLALVQALERGTGLDAVPNLLRRVDGRVQPSAQQVVEDLDALGLPDYTGYEVGKYLVPAWDVLYDPTRGCHWNRCTFCTVSLSTRGAARQRKAVRIADDMQALCERYGTNVISFSTDAIPVPLMRSVSEEIIRRGLTVGWSSEFTLDKGLDRPTLELFAAAGCLLLLFGFESASDRVVRAMRKGTLVSRTERIIRDCAEVGIAVLLHVMVGFPGETEADLEQTLAFIDANGRWIDTYEINAFHLDPGAPIYHQPEIGGITGIGRLKRAFNGQTQLPYRVAAGIPIEQAAELVPVARQRIERAIGFVGQPYLYQDGAQLHLYLKAFGRQHVRG
ncbi:MAG TPA: radical SAM protein, partial [Symbiobacteriaceae bacterium]|nr:radical SAM protein [Symbiobacteriaceae bacterium]